MFNGRQQATCRRPTQVSDGESAKRYIVYTQPKVSTYPVHLDIIEKAINSAIRVAMARPYRYPTKLLYEEFDVPRLTFTYNLQLVLYRFRYNITSDGQTNFLLHSKDTRLNTNRNIRTLKPNSSLYKNSPTYRSIKIYNSLPISIKSITEINLLKKQVAKFLKFLK